jgi:hypothetical protein
MRGFSHGVIAAASLLAIMGCGETTAPNNHFTTSLSGANEFPALTNTGTGTATFDVSGGNLTYTVTWSGLSGNPTASHIHVGAIGATGPVRLNLCGTTATPVCPPGTAGQITGTANDANLSGITMADLLAQIRNFNAYTNVHTSANAGGEIRGQLH